MEQAELAGVFVVHRPSCMRAIRAACCRNKRAAASQQAVRRRTFDELFKASQRVPFAQSAQPGLSAVERFEAGHALIFETAQH